MSHPTDAPPEAEPLTADDVAALKLANSFTLHTHPTLDRLDGAPGSLLRVYVRADHQGVYTTRQQILFPDFMYTGTRARDIIIGGSVKGYGPKLGAPGWAWPLTWGEDKEPAPQCFFSGYERDVWATITRAVRVGTLLKVEWTADNNTETSRDAGLHLDQVKLVAKTGKHVDHWNIGWSACLDNTGRMVRRSR
jgi:hypothetical protein